MAYTSLICSKRSQASESSFSNIKFEISSVFNLDKRVCKADYVKINNRTYQNNLFILEAEAAVKEIRKLWWQIEQAALGDDVLFSCKDEARKQVIDTIALLRRCEPHDKLLRYVNLLNATINSWASLEPQCLLKLSASEIVDCTSPLHHYFHMYLNVRWLLLTLKLQDADTLVEQNIQGVIKDLVALTYVHFTKDRHVDVLERKAFICPCVKQLWILLQLFWEHFVRLKVNNRSTPKVFWDLFAIALDGYDDIFALWLLNHVATLQVSRNRNVDKFCMYFLGLQ